MGNQNLVVLIVLVVLLGVCTNFIGFDFGHLKTFLVPVIGLGYSFWTGHSGNHNNKDEKSGLP